MDWNYFVKSHALVNVYIVLDEENIDFTLTEKAIWRLCNINYGIGSDGILLKVDSENADFGLKIFNPDGSEAEKSGNGLRIFCNSSIFTIIAILPIKRLRLKRQED